MTERDNRTAVPRRPGPGRDAVRAPEAGKPGAGMPSVVAPPRSPDRRPRAGTVSERGRRTAAAGVLACGLLITACSGADRTTDDRVGGAAESTGERRPAARIEHLKVKVLEALPHDRRAFTEGLEMVSGTLYESTGLAGRSSVRAGPPGRKPGVRTSLPAPLFGEGISVVGRTLWQLTWRNGVAIERDARTLAELRRVPYPDEGWGVCLQRDRHRLVTSDGSARLAFRDPGTLATTGEVTVTQEGRPVTGLNELECVGTAVYANVLPTDRILRIDPATGAVTASIDASGLLHDDEVVEGSVLNGIAAVPGTDQFLVTGKFWPRMFRVAFVPA
ncbi:glutaminyl-peptide cyclotransferase [Streptomyces sp. NPDC046984]|uniref:glutaminyl-peptide cyclotransferase n=1 Tax=Streptomyces sp. NPDC046984 TaxID=3155138 RepID=UPI0033FE3A10